MNKLIDKKKYLHHIYVLAFLLIPFISAVLFCAKDGRMINDIYIPVGGWSDEITYYKQIEGILSHVLPRGYFGYNQSRALYGSLAVWGLIPLIPYVIWGFFFGWNYCSPIYANIFFCVAALFVLYKLLRLNRTEMAALAVFWSVNQFLNRYVLSGVIEASIVAQMLILAACGEWLLSKKIRGRCSKDGVIAKDRAVYVLCTILSCFLTLERPYFAVFFLIPFWKSVREKNKGQIICMPLLAACNMVIFFLNSKYFCSTYFSNVLSFEKIRSLDIAGLFESFWEIAKLIWYAMRYRGSGPGWYYLLLLFEMAIMVCVCIWRKYCHKEIPPMFLISLVGDILIVLALVVMYDLSAGARHILALIVTNAVLLVLESQALWGGMLALICVASIFRTQGADALPYKDDQYVQYMDTLKEEFAKVVKVTGEISYDNVVSMPTADRNTEDPERVVCTYYGVLFAMPSGVGISLDFQNFYDDPENLKAKYILVHPEGEIRKILERAGMSCIFENDELMLYSSENDIPAPQKYIRSEKDQIRNYAE